MARNPYAGVGNADPYTNGNGYGGLNAARSPGRRSNEDYDPYGDRYGSPPNSRDERDRRPARNGGYAGFGGPANGSAPAVQPVASRQAAGGYGYDGYNSRPDEQAPPRSPRRPRVPDPRPRQDGGYGDPGRMPDARRRGDRQYVNGNDGGNTMASNRNRGATRGTRQIEGSSIHRGLLHALDRLSILPGQVISQDYQSSICLKWRQQN